MNDLAPVRRAVLSVADKTGLVSLGETLAARGVELISTGGTARALRAAGVETDVINKVNEGRPHVVDMLKNEQIDLIVNTTEGRQSIADSAMIRRLALQNKVCYTTTLAGGDAFAIAIRSGYGDRVRCLQELH